MTKSSKGQTNIFEYYETNVHNEQVILASLFKSPKMRERIFKVVSHKDFVAKKHRDVFKLMLKMEHEHLEFNEDTLLQIAGDIDIGGHKYFKKILKSFEKNANIDFHIEQLVTDRLKFDLFRGPLTQMFESISGRSVKRPKLLEIASRMSDMISQTTETERVLTGDELSDIYVKDFYDRMDIEFIGTGLPELDKKLTEGFSRGTISVISGRPSMGKTVFMVNVISSLMRSKRLLICEIEMGTLLLVDMLVSLHTGISIEQLIKFPHKLKEKDSKRVKSKVRQLLKSKQIHFLDDPELTLDRLDMELRSGKYDVCFIDLFGRLADVIPTPDGYTRKLYQAKRIARGRNTHLCLIHQMRRVKEKEKNKRPSLETLKDSGAWEEVGDLVFGIHREKYYKPQLTKDVAEIIVLKQKRGVSNVSVPFKFNGSICEFGDYVKDYVFGRDLGEF